VLGRGHVRLAAVLVEAWWAKVVKFLDGKPE
jgi:hypothetical protein